MSMQVLNSGILQSIRTLSARSVAVLAVTFIGVACCCQQATAFEPILGEVKMFAGTFVPRGFADCNGQLLSIEENQALYSILGTTYGGDGRTNFALPDLRERTPMHVRIGLGLAPVRVGVSKRESLAINETGANYVETRRTFGIRYIIAVTGMYPSRN